ncbi:YkvA family protein [Streptomyces sp. G2]|uniref:YkvA family protein n=1 Tax=Streptomyces TaxID=1883 RepID=UPI00202F00B6|nr:YkvA family protein [Streptomyces sp. G2]MCM1949410.1 YkvA family protein [Streptomyces sp. G2]
MDGMSGYWWVIAAVLFAATLALAVVLAVRLFRARRMLGDSGIPMSRKVLFWGALLYLVSPADLLPDPILLDDIGILLAALRALQRSGTPEKEPGRTA